MKTRLFSLLGVWCLLWAHVCAAGFPTVSTGDDVTWYVVQFLNGGSALSATTDGGQVKTATLTGSDEQLWKVEGSASAGYTLTSKTGLKLYTGTTAKNGMFYAASAPAGNKLFSIGPTGLADYAGGYEIHPASNTAISMNQWQGAGIGKFLGLWDKNDPNNPLQFVSEEELRQNASLPLIPYPASLVRHDGKLAVNTLRAITYTSDEVKALAEGFADRLARTSGIRLGVEAAGASRRTQAVSLAEDATLGEEAYRLVADADGVSIAASGRAGFFYALQTLKQLLPAAIYGDALQAEADWTLPFVEIEDAPQLGYRGFMLDVARHFFTKEEVKKLIDAAAAYKLNRFHWHLTDDQGWRIEIPEYPRLTTVGAVRKRSLTLNDPTGNREFYDDTEYGRGMFYTLDDLREVVAYAKERNVEIMPEIDMPGHMVAAIAAYPRFSCDSTRTYEVRVAKGISTDVLNIGDDRVIDFLKCVLGHVAEVFPYHYIHLGGDECPTTVWQTNEDCRRRIREEGLSGVNELQPWLVETLGTFLKEKYGKGVVAWNELQDHWKAEYKTDLTIMAWTSTPAVAAGKGFRSIYTKSPLLYFDMMQAPVGDLRTDEPYMGGYGDGVVSSVDMVYNFDPLAGLAADKKDFLLGTQANLWTESCTSDREVEYQFYPRLLALSETAWLPTGKKNWVDFYQRLQQHGTALGEMGLYYAKHYLKDPVPTAGEAALAEARALVEAHVADGVGYPAASVADNLRTALGNLESKPGDAAALAALQTAVGHYKTAAVKQPEAGKTYQIVSASTYYKSRYDGSTVYEKSGGMSFHYTPQVEPEELWTFEPQAGGGYVVRNLMSGHVLAMPSYNAAVTLAESGATAVRIDKAVTATAEITYVPGTVTISAVSGYGGTDVKRLYGKENGQVAAYDDAALAKPGTWRIVEVNDFTAQLDGLCGKCKRLIETSVPGKMGEPSQEALDFLQSSIVEPATQAVAAGGVDKAAYEKYVELYKQYLAMPRLSAIDLISEGHYYYIRNAYFTNYYARANAGSGIVEPKALVDDDEAFRWRFARNADGTCRIYNKATGTAATLASNEADQKIKLGSDYHWTLHEITTDQGNTALAIIDGSGLYSWYTNPDGWSYVLTKPYDWGASVWTLERLEDPTGIDRVEASPAESVYYDLSGRRVAVPARGIYIDGRGDKVLK